MESGIAQFTRISFAAFVVSHVLLEIVSNCFETHRALLNDIALGEQTLLTVMGFYMHIQVNLATEGLEIRNIGLIRIYSERIGYNCYQFTNIISRSR